MSLSDQIIYEDNHLLAVNKLPGQLVQGDKSGDTCLAEEIKAFLKERDHKPGNVFCGMVHRLDRPVSGVVIFAKTSKALTRMNELVKSRDFQKKYHAVTKALPPHEEGHLEDYLIRNERLNKSFVTDNPHAEGAKLAVLDYRVIATSTGGYHLLEIELHTGRHHQIRCQLAHIGCPIKGDLKYGFPRSNTDGSISLHSYSIQFDHPVRHEPVTITAPDPWNLFTPSVRETQEKN